MKKIVNINSLTILILAISLVLLIARVFFLASTVNAQQEEIENLEERIAKIEKHYNETEELSPEVVVKFINNLYKITQ